MNATPIAAKVVVPESSVIALDGQLIVMIVRDGKTHNVPVNLGKHVGDQVEILSGIAVGDRVITSGGYGLEEGYPVKAALTGSNAADSQPTSQPGSTM